MRFQYRLQVLLDQKIQAREEAQQAVAAAQREVQKEEKELEACRRAEADAAEMLRRKRAERISAAAGGSSGELLRWRRAHIQRLEEQSKEAAIETGAQELRVTEAADRVTRARQTLASRTREVEVLERHRVRLERRFHDEVARQEALEQEEMANVMFLQGRRSE